VTTKYVVLLIVFLFIGLIPESYAQRESIDDQVKKADKLFENGDYAEAYPLYTHLLSMKKGNTDIIFKYGATLLYGSDKKADAIPYLKKASSKPSVDVRAHYFMGRAYQLNYEFKKAIISYQNFRDKADEKMQSDFDADNAIRQCENGKKLISNIKEVLVLDKKDVSADEFFRYYDLVDLPGKILIAPEEFQTSLDKKKGHKPVIYTQPLSNVVYYSSYGKKGETGKDIYSVSRDGSGGWTEPFKLPKPINSKYNEDFPIMHSDGKTLFFCSDGHSSMGGYDIFKSEVNLSIGSYETPINMDFAINTPDDDFFYITDSNNETAYFASARSSKQNRLDVYKVKVSLIPSNLIIIKGDFISEINPILKNARITIEHEQTKRQVGVFNTNRKGNYLVDFEVGGLYNYYVETDGDGIIHTGSVEIPKLDYIAAFKQELVIIEDNGKERLLIKNYFDSPLDDDIEALTAEILRKRAMLEVTPEDELMEKSLAAESLSKDADFDEICLSIGFIKTGTNAGVVRWTYNSSKQLKNNNEQFKSLAGNAYTQSEIYKDKATALLHQADSKLKEFKNTGYSKDNIELLKEAVLLRVEAEKNLIDASGTIMLVGQLNKSIKEREDVIRRMEESKEIIKTAIETRDSESYKKEISNLEKLNEDYNSFERGEANAQLFVENIRDIEVKDQKKKLEIAENNREKKSSTLSLIQRLNVNIENANDKDKPAFEKELEEANKSLVSI